MMQDAFAAAYFQWVNALVAAFMIVLVVWAASRRDLFLGLWNAFGLLAVGAAVVIDYFRWNDSAALLVALPLAFSVLVVDLVLLWRGHRQSRVLLPVPQDGAFVRSKSHPRPPFALAEVDSIRDELRRQKDLPLRDELQAVHLWQGGNLAYADAALDVAIEKYRLSVDWVPTAAAHINLAAALLANNQADEAAAASRRAVEMAENSFEAWVNHALALAANGEHEAALQALDRAGELEPGRYELFAARGEVLHKSGKYEEAAAAYDLACRRARRQGRLWYRRGLCLSRIGNHEEALRCFRKAARLNSRHAAAWFNCGNALTRLNRIRPALRCYRRAIRLDPAYAEAYNNRGIAYGKIGKSKRAIRSYERALEVDPEYYEAWLNLALAQDTAGLEKHAADAYRRFVDLAPKTMEKYLSYARKRLSELEGGAAPPPDADSDASAGLPEIPDVAEIRERGMIV
jgi:tetratricopeptide (TPR) repeat protein